MIRDAPLSWPRASVGAAVAVWGCVGLLFVPFAPQRLRLCQRHSQGASMGAGEQSLRAAQSRALGYCS